MQKKIHFFILLSALSLSCSLCSMEKGWGELTEEEEKKNPQRKSNNRGRETAPRDRNNYSQRGQEKIWHPNQNNNYNNNNNNRRQRQKDWQDPRRDNNQGGRYQDRQLQALVDITKEQNQLIKALLTEQKKQNEVEQDRNQQMFEQNLVLERLSVVLEALVGKKKNISEVDSDSGNGDNNNNKGNKGGREKE